MGSEYSSVVLVLKSEYLSTMIKYSPYDNECFRSTLMQYLSTLLVYVKYSWPYFSISTVVLNQFLFNIGLITKTGIYNKNLRKMIKMRTTRLTFTSYILTQRIGTQKSSSLSGKKVKYFLYFYTIKRRFYLFFQKINKIVFLFQQNKANI